VLAAVLFPLLGKAIGFSTTSGGPLWHLRGHRCKRHVFGHRGRGDVGQHVAPGLPDARQGRDRQAHAHPRHHTHHAGARPAPRQGSRFCHCRGRRRGREERAPRAELQPQTRVSPVHTLLRYRVRRHHGRSCRPAPPRACSSR
jgi:hypothetical protein